jgi:hypothetical protein
MRLKVEIIGIVLACLAIASERRRVLDFRELVYPDRCESKNQRIAIDVREQKG